MRRRDFVKGVVAVPAMAHTVLGQQTPSQNSSRSPDVVPVNPPAAPRQAPSSTASGRGQAGARIPPIKAVLPDAVAAPEVHFFTAQQLAALRRLSDLLLPPMDGYPGALQAEAPEFLDFLIGVSPSEQQQVYRFGLDRLNADAKEQFGKGSAQLSSEQADQIVHPGLKPWMSDHPPSDPFARFIATAHQDIRTATMNSESWNAAAIAAGARPSGVGLYWNPIDPIVM
jgi:Gluconate 2-dehydrogenase subunit 3